MHTTDTISGAIHRETSASHRQVHGILVRLANWLVWRGAIRRSRAELLQLNDSQLRDIGVTREQAGLEGCLPWWR